MTRRPRQPRYSELTSLLDVLFILLFASLIQAAGVVSAAKRVPAAENPPPVDLVAETEPVDAAPADREGGGDTSDSVENQELRKRALDEIAESMSQRAVVYAHISAEGTLVALERELGGASKTLELGTPLLLAVSDPQVGVEYVATHHSELRLCTRIRVTLGLHDLKDQLVVVAISAPIAELAVALVEGLRRDIENCFTDERGVAVLVPPEPRP